jgi:hypothetical protein
MRRAAVFFELFGPAFLRLARALEADVMPALEDEFAKVQVTTVAKTLRDIGTAWPDLFAALEAENVLLAASLDATDRGVEFDDAADHDALKRNRILLAAIADAMEAFDAASEEANLRTMRRALMESAILEQRLLGVELSARSERRG